MNILNKKKIKFNPKNNNHLELKKTNLALIK
jgi:hypothetical protein